MHAHSAMPLLSLLAHRQRCVLQAEMVQPFQEFASEELCIPS